MFVVGVRTTSVVRRTVTKDVRHTVVNTAVVISVVGSGGGGGAFCGEGEGSVGVGAGGGGEVAVPVSIPPKLDVNFDQISAMGSERGATTSLWTGCFGDCIIVAWDSYKQRCTSQSDAPDRIARRPRAESETQLKRMTSGL